MGKRSKLPRIPRDLYRTTDPRVIPPLVPHIPPLVRYVEYSAGAGDLIALLSGHAVCVHARDIVPLAPGIEQGDMMEVTLDGADMFIGNPPWKRDLLLPLITYLSDQGMAWMLLDAGLAFSDQFVPFMERCRKIVSVPRLKWFPGTKHTDTNDAAWYCFGPPIPGIYPTLYPRRLCAPQGPAKRHRRVCYDCGQNIGSRGRWRLVQRLGVVTCVHVRCDKPDGHDKAALAEAPLLDFIERSGDMPPGVICQPPGGLSGAPERKSRRLRPQIQRFSVQGEETYE